MIPTQSKHFLPHESMRLEKKMYWSKVKVVDFGESYPFHPIQSQADLHQVSWTKLSPQLNTLTTKTKNPTSKSKKLNSPNLIFITESGQLGIRIPISTEYYTRYQSYNLRTPTFGVNNNWVFRNSLLHTLLQSRPERTRHRSNLNPTHFPGSIVSDSGPNSV